MENATVYLLRDVPWQLFLTLTWRSVKSDGVRFKTLFAFLRTTSEWAGVHFHQLLWAVRQERGELGGRLHFHVLVGGIPKPKVNLSLVFALRGAWRKHGGGMSVVTPYYAGLGAVEYSFGGEIRCTEGTRLSARSSVAGTAYENQKFGTTADVMLAKSVSAMLRSRAVANERKTRNSSSTQTGAIAYPFPVQAKATPETLGA